MCHAFWWSARKLAWALRCMDACMRARRMQTVPSIPAALAEREETARARSTLLARREMPADMVSGDALTYLTNPGAQPPSRMQGSVRRGVKLSLNAAATLATKHRGLPVQHAGVFRWSGKAGMVGTGRCT